MAYRDTWSENEANTKARPLGAVASGMACYPPAWRWSLEKGTHLKGGEPFALHYFNDDGLEVAYWLVDLKSFTVLDPPREWSPCMKPPISPIPAEG